MRATERAIVRSQEMTVVNALNDVESNCVLRSDYAYSEFYHDYLWYIDFIFRHVKKAAGSLLGMNSICIFSNGAIQEAEVAVLARNATLFENMLPKDTRITAIHIRPEANNYHLEGGHWQRLLGVLGFLARAAG